MRIRFWGTRWSVPTPGPGTVRYGGNTSCVEVRTDSGTLLVLDCGTGVRGLGLRLLEEAADAGGPPPAGAILIGHTHWDHIHGLPFFAPLFVPGSRWDVFGARGLGRTLDNVLAGQMEYQYFPIGLDEVNAEVRYHDLVEGVFEFGDATIRTQYLNHPALTLGFRIEADGATVVYASDHEPHDASLAGGGLPRLGSADARHAEFLADADVVVHDTQYDAAGYPAKVGWGHSTMEYAVTLAGASRVGRLVLFHHDPQRDDDAVDDLLGRARALAASEGTALQVDAAAEGSVLEIRGAHWPRVRPAGAVATVVPAMDDLAVGVAIATGDPELEAAVEAAATAEGLRVRPLASNLADAVVVVDVDGGTTPRISTAAAACSASPGGPPRRFPSPASLTGSCCPRRPPTSERSFGPPCFGERAGGWRHPSLPRKSAGSRLCRAWACSTPHARRVSTASSSKPVRSPRRRSRWCRSWTLSGSGSRPRRASMPRKPIETSRSAHTRSSVLMSSKCRTRWRTRGSPTTLP